MNVLRLIIIAFFMSIVMLQTSWSETAYDRQGDVIPPGAELLEGVLDRVSIGQDQDETVIINDTIYRIDKYTLIKTVDGKLTNLSDFKPGIHVEFYVLEGLLTKLISVSNTEENDSVKAPPASGQQTGPVRKEGGIWKN